MLFSEMIFKQIKLPDVVREFHREMQKECIKLAYLCLVLIAYGHLIMQMDE